MTRMSEKSRSDFGSAENGVRMRDLEWLSGGAKTVERIPHLLREDLGACGRQRAYYARFGQKSAGFFGGLSFLEAEKMVIRAAWFIRSDR
jgi:hypothetical protein